MQLMTKHRLLKTMPYVLHTSFSRNLSCNSALFSEITEEMKDIILRKESRLHPRVKKVQNKLLYSDYLESKRLKLGYIRNKKLETKLDQHIELENRNFLLNNPETSIMLKYLTGESVKSILSQDVKTDDAKDLEKPIHMPYATVDKYTVTEPVDEKKSEDVNTENSEKPVSVEQKKFPGINEKFQKLYEKYLSKSTYSLQQPNSNVKHDRTIVRLKKALFEPRLDDSLSKVPSNWMTDYETYDDTLQEFDNIKYGTPQINSKVSSVPCGGCGALLHCKDQAIPGYLPSELFLNQSDTDLKQITCQRCHFMKNYDTALDVRISPDEFAKLLQPLKNKNIAILLMLDLMDFPCSVWPEISSIIGKSTSVFVVANKVDLLPPDSPEFLKHIESCILRSLNDFGIKNENIKHIAFTSAKTGYGIESLITKLHKLWGSTGDVYLIGCTNVGKSSLFNALLKSDYCRSHAVDLVQRATISPWPGTTINLLKFPILRQNPWKTAERIRRLRAEQVEEHQATKLRENKVKSTGQIEHATLQGRIGETYKISRKIRQALKSDKYVVENKLLSRPKKFGLDDKNPFYQNSRWCFDTPGTIQPDQILHLLTTDELFLTMPQKIISPRSFLLKPGQTLFLAGLGRLDCVDVAQFIRCCVFASKSLPINICKTEDADEIYNELLHSDALGVPINNPTRLQMWPKLESRDVRLTGIGKNKSAADVVLSSAGWIGISAEDNAEVKLCAWTPEARGIYVRCPAFLRSSVNLRGERMKNYPAYKLGRQVYVK